jgi:hypothetical protein
MTSTQTSNLMPNQSYTEKDLINPYRPGIEFAVFKDLDQRMQDYYDEIYDTVVNHSNRQSRRYIYELGIKIGFRDIFYAIDLVYKNNPTSVIDLGSSNCFWKRWFPSIWAVDATVGDFVKPDCIAVVDKDWCLANAKKFDAGINICGAQDPGLDIHWIHNQMLLVKDRCLFTFGRRNLRSGPDLDPAVNRDMMLKQLFDLKKDYDMLMLDVPELRGTPRFELDRYAHINGSIRFILAHR